LALAVYENARSLLGWEPAASPTAVMVMLSRLTTLAFYVLIVAAYLRRRAASSTASSPAARVSAIIATFLPFSFPVIGYHTNSTLGLIVANVLLVCGTGFAAWGVRHLDRSFSVIAQARALVTSGPYRWVRHPLYTGELVAAAGVAILVGTPWAVLVWLALLGLQLFRTRYEEAVLTAAFPEYQTYAARTGRLLPRLQRQPVAS